MKHILFFIVALFVLPFGYCQEAKDDNYDDYSLIMMAPINWTVKDRVNLLFKFPKEYHCLQSNSECMSSPSIEFVPKGQNGDNWTEIITHQKIIGKNVSAQKMVGNIKNFIFLSADNFKLLREEDTQESSFQIKNMAASYDFNGEHEVLVCRYYSGPCDCAGIQYTIRSRNGQTDESLLAKIDEYFNANAVVIVGEEISSVR